MHQDAAGQSNFLLAAKEAKFEQAKQRLHDEYVLDIIASKHNDSSKKEWHNMNAEEKKIRIRKLWAKARIFVRLRGVVDSVKIDVELRELHSMLY